MMFGPVFFASIGLKTNFDGFTIQLLWFSLAFAFVAMLAKVIGCGLMAKAWKFSNKDALKCGVGMMTRGEVALIVAQKGLAVGMVEPKYFTSVILLILLSSVASPILLKVLYKGEDKPDHASADGAHPDLEETEEVYAED